MTVASLIKKHFERLLPLTSAEVDDRYIIVTDPLAQREDILEYKVVWPSVSSSAPRLYIGTSDHGFAEYDQFWRHRLKLGIVQNRAQSELARRLEGTRFIQPRLSRRDLEGTGAKQPFALEMLVPPDGEASETVAINFVVGDGGRGKSTALQNLAFERNKQGDSRAFIYVDIHGKSFASIPEHVAFELDRVAPHISFDGLSILASLGLVTLILDGFDELGIELGEEVVFQRLQDFLQYLVDLREEANSLFAPGSGISVLLAGRTQYFTNVNLRQRLSRLPSRHFSWIELEPWDPADAVNYVASNQLTAPSDSEYLFELQTTLDAVDRSQDSALYSLLVHPLVLRVVAEARIPLPSATEELLARPLDNTGIVRILSSGVQRLLEREEKKHIAASGATLFPQAIQLSILETAATEIIRNGEDPTHFDPFIVEYAASLAAHESGLDRDAGRRLLGAAKQHVLFGLGAAAPQGTLGFLHHTLFDVIAGWVVAEKLLRSNGNFDAGISSIFQARHLSDEMLASAAFHLAERKGLHQRLADITQASMATSADSTLVWNLQKLCFDRRVVGDAAVLPSTGSWSVKNARFVQMAFSSESLEGALFDACEFFLCDFQLPRSDSATFNACTWHQSTLHFSSATQCIIREDCQPRSVFLAIEGKEPLWSVDLPELYEHVSFISGVSLERNREPLPKLTDEQRGLLRFAREAMRQSNFDVEGILEMIQLEARLAERFVQHLKRAGAIRQRNTGSFSGNRRKYSVSGDLVEYAYAAFKQGEF